MSDPLSLWRSPIDRVALEEAHKLAARQPRCDYPINLAKVLTTPQLQDTVPIYHAADGQGYQVSLQTLETLIGGGGGGGGGITVSTDLSALTIYQYGAYGALGSAAASINTTAMTNMLAAMTAANPTGGEAWIPQQRYNINFVPGGYPVPKGSVIKALGTGGQSSSTFYHLTATGDGVLFFLAQPHTSAGVQFINLAMHCVGATQMSTTALRITPQNWNVRAIGCNFLDWPVAFDMSGGLGCGLENCTVQYTGNAPSGQVSTTSPVNHCQVPPLASVPADASRFNPTMASLSAPQAYVTGPAEWLQTPVGSGGPSNVVGVGLGGGAGTGQTEHAVISNIHISDFQWGISYCWQTPNAAAGGAGCGHGNYSFIEAQCLSSCVFMMNPHPTAQIFDERYTSCSFIKAHGSTDSSSIIYVDATTNGAGGGSIVDISFTDLMVVGDQNVISNDVYGYQFFSGGNINVIGGTVANMGSTTSHGANIAITGPVNRINIQGVRLATTYGQAQNNNNTSQWAVLISGTPQGEITIEDCNMDGFGPIGSSTEPVHVTGTINENTLFVRNCFGYSNQNVVINNTAPTTAQQFAANQGLSGGQNYYGPQFMFGNNDAGGPLTITIASFPCTIPPSGFFSFFLNSPYDHVIFSSAPTIFHWLGK